MIMDPINPHSGTPSEVYRSAPPFGPSRVRQYAMGVVLGPSLPPSEGKTSASPETLSASGEPSSPPAAPPPLETPQSQAPLASLPAASSTTDSHAHGTEEEGKLMKAALAGDKDARDRLHQYWRLNITEEVRSQSAADIHSKLPEMARRYRKNPTDPFMKHRFHEMLLRAQQLGDTALKKRLRNIYAPRIRVSSQAQQTSVGCGQTSVAMVVQTLTGRATTERYIADHYGFGLIDALNSETAAQRLHWRGADLNRAQALHSLRQGLPVVVGVGWPYSTVQGKGHMFVVRGYDPSTDEFLYADPNGGGMKRTQWREIVNAEPFSDSTTYGSFMFIASRN